MTPTCNKTTCSSPPQEEPCINSEQSSSSSSLVHERQSFQLCAVHTINNLLQLKHANDDGWMCDEKRLTNHWKRATKHELDTIADELTVAESRLMLVAEDETNEEGSSSSTQPTYYQQYTSQHRTAIFGNYSVEVMQTALKRRDVDLSWYNAKQTDIFKVDDPDETVLGFIVNKVEEDYFLGRLIRLFFASGRHWYAITRMQRGSELSDDKRWKVLDSLADEADYITTNKDLVQHLCAAVDNGGAVLRATIRV